MDEASRTKYLALMGIDNYVLRQPELSRAVNPPDQDTDSAQPIIENSEGSSEATSSMNPGIQGLKWIKQQNQNGLLVVFTEQGKDLSQDARALLSKMLQAIDFPAKDCCFAEINASSDAEPISIEGCWGILVFGHEAATYLVETGGAERLPGRDDFILHELPMVATIHPDDLINCPELKPRAWSDLQLIASRITSH